MRGSPLLLLKFRMPKQGKPMVVPITLLASLSQMPFRYYFKTGWFFRYFVYANIICFPLWVWISSKVNSPAAVAAWEAKKREDARKVHEIRKDITEPNFKDHLTDAFGE